MKRSWLARHPVGFMALYSIFYLSVFHYLEANVPLRSILVHCRLDDLIPFCKYAIVPYLLWFPWIPFTLFYLLWKAPRADFWRLCLPLFAGIEGVLLVYPVSWAVGAVLMVLYAWKGKWMQLPEAIS